MRNSGASLCVKKQGVFFISQLCIFDTIGTVSGVTTAGTMGRRDKKFGISKIPQNPWSDHSAILYPCLLPRLRQDPCRRTGFNDSYLGGQRPHRRSDDDIHCRKPETRASNRREVIGGKLSEKGAIADLRGLVRSGRNRYAVAMAPSQRVVGEPTGSVARGPRAVRRCLGSLGSSRNARGEDDPIATRSRASLLQRRFVPRRRRSP